MRKQYTAQQKVQLALEMLKEEKTVGQIAAEYGVHPNQLYRWKTQVLEGLSGIFGKSEKGEKAEKENQAEQEERVEALYAEIGRLSTQVAWLKKKSGIKLEAQ